jgi:hypothetical protein
MALRVPLTRTWHTYRQASTYIRSHLSLFFVVVMFCGARQGPARYCFPSLYTLIYGGMERTHYQG